MDISPATLAGLGEDARQADATESHSMFRILRGRRAPAPTPPNTVKFHSNDGSPFRLDVNDVWYVKAFRFGLLPNVNSLVVCSNDVFAVQEDIKTVISLVRKTGGVNE